MYTHTQHPRTCPQHRLQGLNDLGALTATDISTGISWSNIQDYCTERALCDPDFSLRKIYEWLIGLFFLYSGLTLYFDNVIPDPQGVRKPLYVT
jgi:hypothetical protein